MDLSVHSAQAGRAVAWLVEVVGELDMSRMVEYVVARCRVQCTVGTVNTSVGVVFVL